MCVCVRVRVCVPNNHRPYVCFQVNGQLVDPVYGATYHGGDVQVKMNGLYARVETDFGLVLENDGSWTAIVKLPRSYNGVMNGLCGNSNSDIDDDLVSSNGDDLSGMENAPIIFGNSWQVLDSENPG